MLPADVEPADKKPDGAADGERSSAMHRGQRHCEQSRDRLLSLVRPSWPQLAKKHAH